MLNVNAPGSRTSKRRLEVKKGIKKPGGKNSYPPFLSANACLMDYRLPQVHQNGHNLSGPAVAVAAAAVHHPQPYVHPSYSYLSNPNPDLNPTIGHDNSAPCADAGVLRPPGVDPYAAGGYEGYLAGSYPYIQAAATAAAGGVGLTSYYYGAGGGEAHASYGAVSVFVSLLFIL